MHDGPGIRTTVFMKGCPLSCPWCQNPEGISSGISIFRHPDRCLACRLCEANCPQKAVIVGAKGPVIDRFLCDECALCALHCPSGALEAAGREITVSELLKEVLKDRIIFEESGGGVTFSGGEPLLQPLFLYEALKSIKNQAIHTVVETSGYAGWPYFNKILPFTDLVLFDLKVIKEGQDNYYLGIDSEVIIENLQKLAAAEKDLLIRIPLIPGVNDDRESIVKMAEILRNTGLSEVEIIPFHRLGSVKYESLDYEYRMEETSPPDQTKLNAVRELLVSEGIRTLTGDDY